MYSTKQIGSKYSSGFKTYLTKEGKIISPFHDVPCFDGDYVNCINEIPRFEHGKFEINKNEIFNPIMQDVKKGKIRFIDNIFPFFGYPFNYGAIPQTWEDPTSLDDGCKTHGDNDPVDVIDIGTRRKSIGEVYKAKILGALALIDDNEADWKIIAIDVEDPVSGELNNIQDVEKHFPHLLKYVFRWFRDYKIPTGKPQNSFAFDGKYQEAELAKDVVKKAHESWKRLVKEGHQDICIENGTVKESGAYSTTPKKIAGEEMPDSELPDEIYHFSFV